MNTAIAETLGRVYIYIYQTFIQMFGREKHKLSTN